MPLVSTLAPAGLATPTTGRLRRERVGRVSGAVGGDEVVVVVIVDFDGDEFAGD